MTGQREARHLEAFRRLAGSAAGTVAVEFALASVILLTLLASAIDLSLAARASMKVGNAARAAQDYAAINGWASSGISAAAQSATDMSVTVTPSQFCGCATNTGITTVTCGSTCTSGSSAGTYVQANVSSTYSPVFWKLSSNMSLSAKTITRIQ